MSLASGAADADDGFRRHWWPSNASRRPKQAHVVEHVRQKKELRAAEAHEAEEALRNGRRSHRRAKRAVALANEELARPKPYQVALGTPNNFEELAERRAAAAEALETQLARNAELRRRTTQQMERQAQWEARKARRAAERARAASAAEQRRLRAFADEARARADAVAALVERKRESTRKIAHWLIGIGLRRRMVRVTQAMVAVEEQSREAEDAERAERRQRQERLRKQEVEMSVLREQLAERERALAIERAAREKQRILDRDEERREAARAAERAQEARDRERRREAGCREAMATEEARQTGAGDRFWGVDAHALLEAERERKRRRREAKRIRLLNRQLKQVVVVS